MMAADPVQVEALTKQCEEILERYRNRNAIALQKAQAWEKFGLETVPQLTETLQAVALNTGFRIVYAHYSGIHTWDILRITTDSSSYLGLFRAHYQTSTGTITFDIGWPGAEIPSRTLTIMNVLEASRTTDFILSLWCEALGEALIQQEQLRYRVLDITETATEVDRFISKPTEPPEQEPEESKGFFEHLLES